MRAGADDFSREKEVARAAVRTAAVLCERVRERLVAAATMQKGDKSPVTVADFGAQALVARELERELPSDALMGEEAADALRESEHAALAARVVAEVSESLGGASEPEILRWIDRARDAGGRGRFWTLDPIDGTKGFLRGGQYAIALALLVNGEVKVGALACPRLETSAGGRPAVGTVFLGVRGRGAEASTLDGKPIGALRASTTSELARTRLLESVEAAHGDHGAHESVRSRLHISAPPVRMDSQAKYAVLARGDAEAYLRLPTSEEYRENLWDHAAGALLVEEAGGRVTDMHGARLDFTAGRKLEHNRGVVASNGRVHDAVLAAIAGRAGQP